MVLSTDWRGRICPPQAFYCYQRTHLVSSNNRLRHWGFGCIFYWLNIMCLRFCGRHWSSSQQKEEDVVNISVRVFSSQYLKRFSLRSKLLQYLWVVFFCFFFCSLLLPQWGVFLTRPKHQEQTCGSGEGSDKLGLDLFPNLSLSFFVSHSLSPFLFLFPSLWLSCSNLIITWPWAVGLRHRSSVSGDDPNIRTDGLEVAHL